MSKFDFTNTPGNTGRFKMFNKYTSAVPLLTNIRRSNRLLCSVENVYCKPYIISSPFSGCRRGRDRKVVGYTTSCAISAYHH